MNIKKQNSFKKRTKRKEKIRPLVIGNLGFKTILNFRFEFIYFMFLKKVFKKNLKTKFNSLLTPKMWVFIKSNYPLSRKSKNSRMGKGKGSFLRWSILTRKGQIIIELANFNTIRAKIILKKWNFSLSKKIILINH